jgi:hypothetical protein
LQKQERGDIADVERDEVNQPPQKFTMMEENVSASQPRHIVDRILEISRKTRKTPDVRYQQVSQMECEESYADQREEEDQRFDAKQFDSSIDPRPHKVQQEQCKHKKKQYSQKP